MLREFWLLLATALLVATLPGSNASAIDLVSTNVTVIPVAQSSVFLTLENDRPLISQSGINVTRHLYQVGLDTDEASTNGCSLDLGAEGSQAGFEKLLELRVDSNYSPPVLATLQLVSCVSGEWDFENAEELSQGGWNAGIDTGEGDSDFIEGFVPIASLGSPPTVQFAVKATAVSGAVDALVNSGDPIPIPEPAAAWAALAVILALCSRRRYRAMRAAALALVFCVVVRPGYAEPTASDFSGSVADWTGISPVASDEAGDASDPAADLVSFYAAVVGENLVVRIDVSDLEGVCSEAGDLACDGVCGALDSSPGDCDGVCDASDAVTASADCDGVCGDGEAGNFDCDGNCLAGDEPGSLDCNDVCSPGEVDGSRCNDGLFCTSGDVCSQGVCVGMGSTAVDDAIACTVDSCDEAADIIVHSPNDSACDNGAFCDGAETCHATLGCQDGTAPTTEDGVSCTDDSCDDVNDQIVNAPNDSACDNGLFCDGAETCDAILGCQSGPPPSPEDGNSGGLCDAVDADGNGATDDVPDTWLTVDFPVGEVIEYDGMELSPICSKGTPWSLFAQAGTVNKLLVYYQGGGACWNGLTCIAETFDTNVETDPEVGGSDHPARQSSGIANFEDPDNPFRDWHAVFVPYCTGDVHWGDTEVEYQFGATTTTIHHKGAINAMAAESWIAEHFTGPEQVFVTGSSGGAYAAVTHSVRLQELFPDAQFDVVGDGGNGVVTQDFLVNYLSTWGIERHLPEEVPELNVPLGELDMSGVYEAIARAYPNGRFATYTTAFDGGGGAQTFFYHIMQNAEDLLAWGTWWESSCEWNSIMRELNFATAAAVPNFRYYVGVGSAHTIWGRDKFYTDTAGGVPTFVDWIDTMLYGSDEEWVNVECTDCGMLLEGDDRPDPPAEPFVDTDGDEIADIIDCPGVP